LVVLRWRSAEEHEILMRRIFSVLGALFCLFGTIANHHDAEGFNKFWRHLLNLVGDTIAQYFGRWQRGFELRFDADNSTAHTALFNAKAHTQDLLHHILPLVQERDTGVFGKVLLGTFVEAFGAFGIPENLGGKKVS
jgi:hypothetical protein